MTSLTYRKLELLICLLFPMVATGINKELGCVTLMWLYSYATAPSDCKVGKQIDFRELVYMMNGTLLRAALI